MADQYYTKKVYALTFNSWKNKYYNNKWVKVCSLYNIYIKNIYGIYVCANLKFLNIINMIIYITILYNIPIYKYKSSDAKADNLYKHNLIKKYLLKWKSQRNDWHSIYNHYEIQPIIYWSITLSKKVLEAWKNYSFRKKDMRKRIIDAENWKKENDLKNGIMTWLKVHIYKQKKSNYFEK